MSLPFTASEKTTEIELGVAVQSMIFKVIAGFLFVSRSIPDRTLRQVLVQFRRESDGSNPAFHVAPPLAAALSPSSETENCWPIDVFWIDTAVLAMRSASSCQQRKTALLTSSISPQDCSKACFT